MNLAARDTLVARPSGKRTGTFAAEFAQLTGHTPYPYQERVATALLGGHHVLLRAPTGSGKTHAVLVPFALHQERYGWSRLIYALPMRTLAEGIFREAKEIAARAGWPCGSVSIQTGERPDDQFLERGKIVVTTYDQVLSGLLCGPYGLSSRQHNINAAALVGTLVVFDEFHLMEPDRAFLTATAGIHLFRDLVQSVWMTATATGELQGVLLDALPGLAIIELPADEMAALPSVAGVRRRLVMERAPLDCATVVDELRRGERSIVICNTVGRAQGFYGKLKDALREADLEARAMLLHSRFFGPDRQAKEAKLKEWFGEGVPGPAVLVATQVVEAGLNLSCDHLHTELCPANALVQRAGRCARFPGEEGTVHVHPLPDGASPLPYGAELVERTRSILPGGDPCLMSPDTVSQWVQAVHGADDDAALRLGWKGRLDKSLDTIWQIAALRQPIRVAHLIREESDTVRVVLAESPPETPADLEGIALRRSTLRAAFREPGLGPGAGWYWVGEEGMAWKAVSSFSDLENTYAVCLRPTAAAYDDEVGLQVGVPGGQVSPPRARPERPGHRPTRAESWLAHAQAVRSAVASRVEADRVTGPFLAGGWSRRYGFSGETVATAAIACAALHDLGKLQEAWQRWARAVQAAASPHWVPAEPLAHTDFDPDNPVDRAREREVTASAGGRPAHAAAGAYYACRYIPALLEGIPEHARAPLTAACVAAILAHHGGWLGTEAELEIDALIPEASAQVRAVVGRDVGARDLLEWSRRRDRKGLLEMLLKEITTADRMVSWWPLTAYLTRTLRLADQRATREGGEG